MNRQLKNFIGIAAIFITIIASSTAVTFYKKQKAVRLAKEYVLEKYAREMMYRHTTFVQIDPSMYHVYFSPADNPGLVFEVLVQSDLSAPELKVDESGSFSPDNYLLSVFRDNTKAMFGRKMQEPWGSVCSVEVLLNGQPFYSFKTAAELHEHMAPSDMEQWIDYDLHITVDHVLTGTITEREAQRIWEAFALIRETGYTPEQVHVWYKTGTLDKKRSICFVDWPGIASVRQIEEQLDSRWLKQGDLFQD